MSLGILVETKTKGGLTWTHLQFLRKLGHAMNVNKCLIFSAITLHLRSHSLRRVFSKDMFFVPPGPPKVLIWAHVAGHVQNSQVKIWMAMMPMPVTVVMIMMKMLMMTMTVASFSGKSCRPHTRPPLPCASCTITYVAYLHCTINYHLCCIAGTSINYQRIALSPKLHILLLRQALTYSTTIPTISFKCLLYCHWLDHSNYL